ncbi:MAG TPA: hypothetical protein DCS19_01340 [Flavobacterium sp.]|nr:hypothetical protein [Flavobacterium sp.]
MIKKIHQITLNDVIILDATKSASHLKKYWFIPMFLCYKQLEKLASKINELIGDNSIDELQVAIEKLLSYRRIQVLEALYNAAIIEFNLKSQINIFKIIEDGEINESKQLLTVISEIKRVTGIEIKTPNDLHDFEEYVKFKIDKHKETYPEQKQDDTIKQTNLQKILYSVFSFMGEPYNVNMLLISFVEMKQIAEDKIKKQQIQQENG